jgi:hypothetical protein
MRRLSIVLFVVALCSCKSEPPPPAAAKAAQTSTQFEEVVEVKQLMTWIIEPSADVIWGSTGTVVTAEGEQNMRPETDEQWTAIRNAAATVAESGNLLLTPGRIRDEDWVKHVRELTRTAKEVLAAAEAKDVDTLFTAGGDVYLVCSACHEQYALDLKKVQ